MLTYRIKQALKAFFEDRALGKQLELGDEPHFLFVITPPYSGSTALAQVLNSGPGTALLQERGEAQWLVPGMSGKDRWDPEMRVDWETVRFVWLKRVALLRALVQNVDVIIEKSPPNMVRIDQLTEVFPNHSLVAFNRDPFANCASILYRHHDPDRKSEQERIEIVKRLAADWLGRSKWVRKWIEERDATPISYEDFCERPRECVASLTRRVPQLAEVDVDTAVRVKDYEPQPISNQNARQVGNLREGEIGAIAGVLRTNAELVRFHGYDPEPPPVERS